MSLKDKSIILDLDETLVHTYDEESQFLKNFEEIYVGKINSDIMAAAKKVIRMRHVGLEKVKLVRTAEAEIALLEA